MDMQKVLDDAALAEEKKKQEQAPPTEKIETIELTDEQFEAEFEKRMGAKRDNFIKKEEQIVVLTPEEKIQAEEKKQNEILKFAIDKGIISAKENEEYVLAKGADKVEIGKKLLAEIEEGIDGEISELFKLDEPDELEEGEEKKPNKAKAVAKKILEKLGNNHINSKYSKFANLGPEYEAFIAAENLKKANGQLIETTVSGLAKRLEIEVEGEKFGFDLKDEDFTEVKEMFKKDALSEKGLTAEKLKKDAELALEAKHLRRMLKEVKEVSFKKGKAEGERGKHGVVPLRDNIEDDSVEKTEGHKLVDEIKKAT